VVKVNHLVLGHPGHLPERLFSSIKTKYQRTMIGMYITNSVVLTHGHAGAHANLCMLCTACFFYVKH
jgi:hypothetical protein